MSLKSAVKRLEKELAPAPQLIIYTPLNEVLREAGGMIKVIDSSKPGDDEIISYEECDRRVAEARARGDIILGPRITTP